MKLKCLSLIVSVLFLSGCRQYIHQQELSSLLGVKKAEILNKGCKEELGDFGKGYAIEIYDVDKATQENFLHAPPQTLPNKPDTIPWKSKGWQPAPLDTVYDEIYFRAFNYMPNDPKFEKLIRDIYQSVSIDKYYYAFYYYPDLYNIRSSQLCLYNVSKNKIYIIDSDF